MFFVLGDWGFVQYLEIWVLMAIEVDGLPTGWPLGLETVNVRVRIMETIRAAEPDSFHLATPSFSSLSSSDLDTESTRSFFPDKSITLGTLIGIRTGHTTLYRGHPVHPQDRAQIVHRNRASRRNKSCAGVRKWRSFIGCMHFDSTADNSAPSLGQFLEAHRRSGVSFIDTSGEEKIYINIMTEESDGIMSNGNPSFLHGHVNPVSRVNSASFHALELPVIEENPATLSNSGGQTGDSPTEFSKVRGHHRVHSLNSCMSLVSNILVKMSPGGCSPIGKINHL